MADVDDDMMANAEMIVNIKKDSSVGHRPLGRA
jgi:hypothetical protein